MPDQRRFLSRVSERIFRWRWLVVGGLGAVMIILEINERYELKDFNFDLEFVAIIVLAGIALPGLVGYLLGLVETTTLERYYAVQHLSYKETLSQQINTASSFNELVKVIVEFPRFIAPMVGSVLSLHNATSGYYEQAALWGFYGVPLPPNSPWRSSSQCQSCALLQSRKTLTTCDCGHTPQAPVEARLYCLPLVHSGQIVGLLQLYLSENATITNEQVRLLNSLSSEMALALDAAGNKRLNTLIQESAEADRQHIAKDLHDNLAQSLIFVRQKLDQLTGEDALLKISSLQQDLQNMRAVVDDAYVAVRSTLKEIETSSTIDLAKMLVDYSHTFEGRAKIKIHTISNGQPRKVATRTARQVLYIFGEMMANIEKHALAQQVEVKLDWQLDGLSLIVNDNGCGFDLAANRVDGHMGLSIMHDRAEEIHGKLTINSKIGMGTQVTLWLPLAPSFQVANTYENSSYR
jgi:signal transduction histidine kinase